MTKVTHSDLACNYMLHILVLDLSHNNLKVLILHLGYLFYLSLCHWNKPFIATELILRSLAAVSVKGKIKSIIAEFMSTTKQRHTKSFMQFTLFTWICFTSVFSSGTQPLWNYPNPLFWESIHTLFLRKTKISSRMYTQCETLTPYNLI